MAGKPVLAILLHDPNAPPGRIIPLLQEWGVRYTLLRPCEGESLPPVESCAGAILLGGEPSLLAPPSWLEGELHWLRLALSRELPLFGICLGAQILAQLLGGTVQRRKEAEMGWLYSRVSSVPPAASWFQGLPRKLLFLQWHHDAFLTPPQATCVLRGPGQANHHGFIFKNSLAIQGHLEVEEEILRNWCEGGKGESPPTSELLTPYAELRPLLHATLRLLLLRFLKRCKGSP